MFKLEELLSAARAGGLAGSPLHGERHWAAVAALGLDLCAVTPGSDPVVAFLFGLLHDCRREHEGHDPAHGARAARLVEQLAGDALAIGEQRLELLERACRQHTSARTVDDATIAVCLDADRLNLWRCGITPAPQYLSTAAARDDLWRVSSQLYHALTWSWPQLARRAQSLAQRTRTADNLDLRLGLTKRSGGRFVDAVASRRWLDALKLRDRNDGPALLAEWRDELTRDELREIAPFVWRMAEFPICRAFSSSDWVALWREIGFVSTAGTSRPRFPVTLYRGAPAANSAWGMSWTNSREYARHFARTRCRTIAGAVLKLEAPPQAMLAVIELPLLALSTLGLRPGVAEVLVLPDFAARHAVTVETVRPAMFGV